MEDSTKKYITECHEYCEPIFKACLASENSDEHCDDKLEQCLSYCEYA